MSQDRPILYYYHLVGDDAFALDEHQMKPYSHRSQVPHERIYSYRLSRARRIVENTFGLLQTRFRVFTNNMFVQPRKVQKIAMCAVVLHNLFLGRMPLTAASREVDRETPDHQEIPGAWRDGNVELHALTQSQARNPGGCARHLRNYLAQYYSSPAGVVSWQERIVFQVGRK